MGEPSGKTLVKDGRWLVPEGERPANWRDILPESTTPLLDAIVSAVVEAPAPPEPPVVEKPAPKPKTRYRHALYPLWEEPDWKEMKEVILCSGRDFCGETDEKGIIPAALVLFAGMYTRTGPILRKMTGVRNEKRYVKRCYELGLWNKDDRRVVLGEFAENALDFADLEFWMIAMAVAGVVHRHADGTFQSIESLSK